jgi:hypothetical protein
VNRGDRHDARQDRLGDAEFGEFTDQARPLNGLEEELRDGEVGQCELLG